MKHLIWTTYVLSAKKEKKNKTESRFKWIASLNFKKLIHCNAHINGIRTVSVATKALCLCASQIAIVECVFDEHAFCFVHMCNMKITRLNCNFLSQFYTSTHRLCNLCSSFTWNAGTTHFFLLASARTMCTIHSYCDFNVSVWRNANIYDTVSVVRCKHLVYLSFDFPFRFLSFPFVLFLFLACFWFVTLVQFSIRRSTELCSRVSISTFLLVSSATDERQPNIIAHAWLRPIQWNRHTKRKSASASGNI